VINYFRRCDFCIFDVLIFVTFDVLITLINLFDVVIISNFFNVLFGFRRCEIRSSDLFPFSPNCWGPYHCKKFKACTLFLCFVAFIAFYFQVF
jgi:hypothetical protein